MHNREFPELPMVGVGGVVIDGDRALLVRRGTDPARGEWTIPGGLLELGETLAEGVERELFEETGLMVRAVELIEALERIFHDPVDHRAAPPSSTPASAETAAGRRPRYHYVILDYLCERMGGELKINEELTDAAFVDEKDLENYGLTPIALRVIRKAFSIARTRAER